jgi:hypothetical protein
MSSESESNTEHSRKRRRIDDEEIRKDLDCPLREVTPMKKPRATVCHHIFCKRCIQDHFNNEMKCPMCQFSLG